MKYVYCLLGAAFLASGCHNITKSASSKVPSKGTSSSNTITVDPLLDTLQRQTFEYFWSGAEENSGLARERIHMVECIHKMIKILLLRVVGIGMMAILIGVKNGYITRAQALERI